MSYISNQFPTFLFCGQHTKSHRVLGLSNNYHLFLYPLLGQVICAIHRMSCLYIHFIQTWSPVVSHNEQPLHQPVLNCKYWPVLFYFIKWNINKFTNKGTSSKAFDDIQNILLGGISDNMTSLSQTCKYGAMNKIEKKGYHVIKYVSRAFTLQEDTTVYSKIIKFWVYFYLGNTTQC